MRAVEIYEGIKRSVEETWLFMEVICDEVYFEGKWYYVMYSIDDEGNADIKYFREL